MSGEERRRRFGVTLAQRLARARGLRRVGAEARRQLRIGQLHRRVDHVAGKHTVRAAAVGMQQAGARRVAVGGFQVQALGKLVVALDQIGQACLHHRQHAVGEGAVICRRVPALLAFPVLVFAAPENVACIGKGRHPAPVLQAGVPADMVGVQMGAEHEVDLFGMYAGRSKTFQVRGFLAVPHRPQGALLVVADAAVDQNRLPCGAQQKAVETHHHQARVVDEVGLQPALRLQDLRVESGQQEVHGRKRALGLHHPRNRDVADQLHLSDGCESTRVR